MCHNYDPSSQIYRCFFFRIYVFHHFVTVASVLLGLMAHGVSRHDTASMETAGRGSGPSALVQWGN